MTVSDQARTFIRPAVDELRLDHTGHWLSDAQAARDALVNLGFVVTPFSEQQVPGDAGEMISAGTGNQCVMLDEGYLEFLTPLSATPTGQELTRGISRYQGLHIAAFDLSDAQSWHERCEAAGFPQNPVLDLRRDVKDEADTTVEARFAVARSKPPGMPEGRFQALVHHTPEAIWQSRYLDHPNSACALVAIVVLVEDIKESTDRYSRWFARRPSTFAGAAVFELDRGGVVLADATTAAGLIGVAHGATCPGIAGVIVGARDVGRFPQEHQSGAVHWNALPPSLGGALGVVASSNSFNEIIDAWR